MLVVGYLVKGCEGWESGYWCSRFGCCSGLGTTSYNGLEIVSCTKLERVCYNGLEIVGCSELGVAGTFQKWYS